MDDMTNDPMATSSDDMNATPMADGAATPAADMDTEMTEETTDGAMEEPMAPAADTGMMMDDEDPDSDDDDSDMM